MVAGKGTFAVGSFSPSQTAGSLGSILPLSKIRKRSKTKDPARFAEHRAAARALGIATVGGGAFCDRLENDRSFGFKVAKDAGALLPPYEEFASFDQARARAARPRCC